MEQTLVNVNPPQISVGRFTRQMGSWLRDNLKQVTLNMVIAGLIGWLINIYLLAFKFQGFRVNDPDAPVTGLGSMAQGTLFWSLASMVVFMLFGYWRAMGSKRFFKAILGLPKALVLIISRDGRGSLIHILAGIGISLLAAAFLSPWTAGIVAIGLFAFIPTILGQLIAGLASRAWYSIAKRLMPARAGGGIDGMLVTFVGVAVAMSVAYFIPSDWVKIGFGLACCFAAIALSRLMPASGLTTFLAAVAISFIYALVQAQIGFADDGGWNEACSGGRCTPWGWATSSGSGTVLRYSGVGGLLAGVFAGIGSALGGAVGTLSAAPISPTVTAPPPHAKVPPPSSKSPKKEVSPPQSKPQPKEVKPSVDAGIVTGQEALDELVKLGAQKEPKSGNLIAGSVEKIPAERIRSIAFRGNTISSDDVAIVPRPPSESGLPDGEGAPQVELPDDPAIDQMRQIGINPKTIKGQDGGRYIQAPEELPEDVTGAAYRTRSIVDEAGNEQLVVDSEISLSHASGEQTKIDAPAGKPPGEEVGGVLERESSLKDGVSEPTSAIVDRRREETRFDSAPTKPFAEADKPAGEAVGESEFNTQIAGKPASPQSTDEIAGKAHGAEISGDKEDAPKIAGEGVGERQPTLADLGSTSGEAAREEFDESEREIRYAAKLVSLESAEAEIAGKTVGSEIGGGKEETPKMAGESVGDESDGMAGVESADSEEKISSPKIAEQPIVEPNLVRDGLRQAKLRMSELSAGGKAIANETLKLLDLPAELDPSRIESGAVTDDQIQQGFAKLDMNELSQKLESARSYAKSEAIKPDQIAQTESILEFAELILEAGKANRGNLPSNLAAGLPTDEEDDNNGDIL